MPAPPVETWDAIAVYERPGTRFGHCLFNGNPQSSPEITITWIRRISLDTGQFQDDYRLDLMAIAAMKDIFFNITFSRYLDPGDINGFNDSKTGIRTNQLYVSLLEKNIGQGDSISIDFSLNHYHDKKQDFCIIDIMNAVSVEDFQPKPTSHDAFDPTTSEFLFNSHIWYKCGIGRAFELPGGERQIIQDFYCEWSGSWSPQGDLHPCVCKFTLIMFFTD